MRADALTRARRDLDFIAGFWEDLRESRIPGTPRPWLSRRRNAAQQHPELASLGAIGHSPAPCHVDVLDVLVDLLAWADVTAEAVADALGRERLPHAASAYGDPRPYLDAIRVWLSALADDEPTLAEAVVVEAADEARRVQQTLGMVLDGQVIDAPCPWCTSWGALRVFWPDDADPIILCTSGVCEPPGAGTWWRGRPGWRFDEWPRLAAMIEHREAS